MIGMLNIIAVDLSVSDNENQRGILYFTLSIYISYYNGILSCPLSNNDLIKYTQLLRMIAKCLPS